MTEVIVDRSGIPETRQDRREWIMFAFCAFSFLALLAAISLDFLVLVAIALVVVVVGWIELRILVYAAVFLIPWQIYMMNMPGSTYTFRLEDVVVAVATAATVVRFPGTLRVCLTGWMIPILLFVAVAVGQGLASGDVYDTGKFIAD